MNDLLSRKRHQHKYKVFARIINIFAFIAFCIFNWFVFFSGSQIKINWQWTILVIVGGFILGLSFWLIMMSIAKIFHLNLSAGQTKALRLLLSAILIVGVTIAMLKVGFVV